ncbi:hypothetical protein PA25_38900 [Pseudoalteromonas sp. A25]|uniref:ATP-binding protein n=1 Tax=Pseudoalteromonas sp. A25 TaxID=116092 RepID=UPI00126080E1|nr:ATP-binding protein [Pseudoalteromonas sp. A25]BBN83905.1 hypothetical protein PA25_38900 [Pseudoalteromonas sp. A25]
MVTKASFSHAIKNRSLSGSLLLLIMVMVAVLWKYDDNLVNQTQHSITQQLSNALTLQKETFKNEIKIYRNYINFLVDTPPIQGISRAQRNQGVDPKDSTTTEQWKTRLSMIFSSMMYTYGEINQLRLLDGQTGDELVRADRYGGLVSVQPAAKLQNKAHRDYFSQTVKLKERRIYASQIDLNREHGEIIYPLEPTLRVATPIYNENNELFAVLVANLDAQVLLDKLKNVLPLNVLSNVLTPDGHFIYHPNEALRFTKDLNANITWQSHFQQKPWLIDDVFVASSNNMNYLAMKTDLFVSSNSESGEIHGVSLIPYAHYEEALFTKRFNAYSLIFMVVVIFTLGLLALWAYFINNRQLLETRAQLADIINGASDGIIGFNNQLEITSHNIAAKKLFTELQGVSGATYQLLKRYIPEDYFHSTLYSVSHKLPPEVLEIQTDVGGEMRDICITASPIHSVEDHLIGFALFATDTTEQNKAKTEVVKINESLEAQVEQRTLELDLAKRRAEESSNVKSAFISSVSHEMRTPLNGILGTLELVKRDALNQQQSNYLEMMSTSAKTLLRLINDVLDLSKIEAGKLDIDSQPFNPIHLIEHVTKSVGITAHQKHLQYLLDITGVRYLSITGDAVRLKQVLYNLISNAIKFTSKGGVYINVRTRDETERLWLDVSIKDTGVGIAKKHYQRLFEAFSQETKHVSSEFGGTGLGLSICKQLCELMGGSIKFQSVKGTGSTFSFSIPYPRCDAKPLYVRPILNDKKIFLAAKTVQEEHYWKKVLTLFGALICDLNQAEVWLVDYGSEFGQNLSTAPNLDKKACFIFDPITDPSPPKYALAAISKPVSYIDVLMAFNKQDTLALFEIEEAQVKSPKFVSELSALNGQTVIVVDDNQINLEVAKGILNAQNINSILVNSGQALLEKLNCLAEEKTQILAILMDCNMPIMDGFAATAAVRSGEGSALYKSLPIVALTASAMEGVEERCKSVGMNDYATKPIDAHKLFNILIKYSDMEPHTEQVNSVKDESSDIRDIALKDTNLPSLDSASALSRLMEDQCLYTKICELFKESASARLAEMTEAIERVDHEKIKQAAHALKGQAGDVGAKRLHYLSDQLEIAAKDRAQSNTHSQIHDAIQTELHHVFNLIDSQILNVAS